MKIILTFAVFFYTATAFAQGFLNFEKKDIILKDLIADEKPTEVIFTVKNTGKTPVIITNVSPVSQLITATWDKTPLLPGKTGMIKASFSSSAMPENFNYSITVYSNASNNRERISVQANITDNPAQPYLLYKYDMEGVKFKTNIAQFDNIYSYQILSDTLYFFNTNKESVTLEKMYSREGISLKCIPATVAPGKRGMVIVTFNAPEKNDYGYCFENLLIKINNKQSYGNRISVIANITEDFSKLSKEERENPPVVFCEKETFDFGKIKEGAKATCKFTLTNKGNRELIIRKTKTSCGCTAVTPAKTNIRPGESTVIEAIFDSTGKSGRQNKSVTVTTNDPKKSELILTITGNVTN